MCITRIPSVDVEFSDVCHFAIGSISFLIEMRKKGEELHSQHKLILLESA